MIMKNPLRSASLFLAGVVGETLAEPLCYGIAFMLLGGIAGIWSGSWRLTLTGLGFGFVVGLIIWAWVTFIM